MPGNISDYAENKILEHSVGKTAWTMPTGAYLGLFTVTPTDAGGGTEVTGNAYARQQSNASWAVAAAGSIATNADLTFPVATPAGWGTIVAVGLFDALTVGNLLWWGPLTANKTIGAGDQFKIASGSLTLTLD